MKTEINYTQIPFQYLMCLKKECSQANTCLRQLAEQATPANIREWLIISPKLLDSLKGACPYYRPNGKVLFAKGFINLLNDLPHKQMEKATNLLSAHFNRRNYYRLRKGERLLSPSEQQAFWKVLKDSGISSSSEFDAYEEGYDW